MSCSPCVRASGTKPTPLSVSVGGGSFTANFVSLASALYLISKKSKKSGSSGISCIKTEKDNGIDKSWIGIVTIAVAPAAVSAIAPTIAAHLGAIGPDEAFEIGGIMVCGWPILTFLLVWVICICAYDSVSVPLICLSVMDVVIAVTLLTLRVMSAPKAIAFTLVYFAIQLALTELSVGSVSWLIKNKGVSSA